MTIERSAQFEQLQMLATPDEIRGWHSNDFRHDTMADVPRIMRDPDENESASTRAYNAAAYGPYVTESEYLDSMRGHVDRQGGISRPVVLGHRNGYPTLLDGHHRAVVALESNRLLPVVHDAPYSNYLDEHDRNLFSKHGSA